MPSGTSSELRELRARRRRTPRRCCAPDCLSTSKATAGSPLARIRGRISRSRPRRAPTSREAHDRAVRRRRDDEARDSSTLLSSPSVRTLISALAFVVATGGDVEVLRRGSRRRSPSVREVPSASICARSRSTWTSRSAPPRTSTEATPSTCSSAGLSTSSAKWRESRTATISPAQRVGQDRRGADVEARDRRLLRSRVGSLSAGLRDALAHLGGRVLEVDAELEDA